MKKLFLLLLLAGGSFAHGQNTRFDSPTGLLNGKVSVCSSPANGLPCTNYVTTYDSAGNACSNSAQDTPGIAGSKCQPTTDSQGHPGFWIPAGTYDYTLCNGGDCRGPFTVTVGGGGGGGGSVSPATIGEAGFYTGTNTIGGDAGFTYSQSSGAVTSNFISNQSPAIDPRSFGCNGTSDSPTAGTACWQAAVDLMAVAGNNGTVVCAAGTVWTLNRVVISNGGSIVGSGANPFGCRIFVNSDSVFVPSNPPGIAAQWHIRNIQFTNGVNPIDTGGGVEDSDFTNLVLTNYTGCGIFIGGGTERVTINSIHSAHSSAHGFATLCSGDYTKSVFSSTIRHQAGGIARGVINDIQENGGTPTAVPNEDWLWYGSSTTSGALDSGGLADVNATQLGCAFSCAVGIMQFDTVFASSFESIGLDNVGVAGTPEPVGINFVGQFQASRISGYNPFFNTNRQTIAIQFNSLQQATVENMTLSPLVDNVTTFGMYLQHGSSGATLNSIYGGIYDASFSLGGGLSTSNVVSTAIIGSLPTPTNIRADVQLGSQINGNVDLFLYNNNNAALATGHFWLERGNGTGGPSNTHTYDIDSDGVTLKVGENIGFTHALFANTAPTISSGFGTSPSIASSNGAATFRINVGTGGSATSGVIAMPTATAGYNCSVNDLTAAAGHQAYNTVQTASTTASVTIENQTKSTGAAVAWAASDILTLNCAAF